MRVTIVTNGASNSARNLQEALREADVEASRAYRTAALRCRGDRYVINLGVSEPLRNFQQRNLFISNTAEAVRNCQDKRLTFRKLNEANVATLEWSENRRAPAQWLRNDGKVVVRATATGHSGSGISIVRTGGELPEAPLYTRYFRKHAEYRVHVAFGNVILVQQKRRRNGAQMEDNANLVRTHTNGWVFTTQRLSSVTRGYAEALNTLALSAATAVGAAHCAVDILVSHDSGSMVVCEINSAPAMEAGSTLEAYTRAFAAEISRRE